MWKLPRLPSLGKRDEFTVVADDLETRAHRLTERHNARAIGNDEVVRSIAQFVRVLGRANATATMFTVAVVLLALVNIGMAVWQVHEAKVATLDQTDLTLNAQLYGDADNKAVLAALEVGKPVLVEHGGQSTPVQLGLYLDTFQNVDNAFDDDLPREEDLCDDFSHYINLTLSSPEVRAFIADQRNEDPRYYGALDDLHDAVAKSKDPDCRDYRPSSRSSEHHR